MSAEVAGNTAIAGVMTGEVVNAGASLAAGNAAVSGVFGPFAVIAGELSVGTCEGC